MVQFFATGHGIFGWCGYLNDTMALAFAELSGHYRKGAYPDFFISAGFTTGFHLGVPPGPLDDWTAA
jgi:hypothetical protein